MLNIKSNPDGAEVYLDGQFVGNTPYTVTKPDGDKQLKLELRQSGYESRLVPISARTSDMTLTLKKVEEKAAHPSATKAAKRPRAENGSREERPANRGQSQTEVLDPWN
jgi:hypothetical protein